jgi:phosphate transport system permease protein
MTLQDSTEHLNSYPEGAAGEKQVVGRQRRGAFWSFMFRASTFFGILALLALLYNVVNSAFGFVMLENEIDPAVIVQQAQGEMLLNASGVNPSEADQELTAGVAVDANAIGFFGYAYVQEHRDTIRAVPVDGVEPNAATVDSGEFLPTELADLPKETLVGILESHVSSGLMRRFESDQPFAERTQENVYELVVERVVESTIVKSWSLVDSIFKRSEIEAEVATVPNAELTFRSWVTGDFITSAQSSEPQFSGVRTAIFGSLWVILVTILFALPIGVGAAIYLEEYAENNRFNRLIETNINNLAGVPSIIYGMLGLAIFVRALEVITSGRLFGVGDPTTTNGRTILSAGLTLALLILPLLIINAREAIRSVPSSLRQASYALGATKWQTTWNHVLPGALGGILTGTILAISRAIGETAPLVVIGASTFIVADPDGPFAKFTTLPIQIYQWTSRPQAEFRNLAAAAILVLLILLLSLNATAVILRNRYSRQGS